MTNPMRTCTAIIGVAESISSNWDLYETVEAGLLPSPLRGTSYDSAGGHSTAIPDPTGQLAVELTASGHGIYNLADTTDALEAVLTQLRWVQSRVNTLIRQHPDLARDAQSTLQALRCDGSIDPTCTRNAVKGGICWACTKRRQRGVVDMSPGSVLEDVASDARPVEPMLPNAYPGTTYTCARCSTDYDVLPGRDPLQALAEHKAACIEERRLA